MNLPSNNILIFLFFYFLAFHTISLLLRLRFPNTTDNTHISLFLNPTKVTLVSLSFFGFLYVLKMKLGSHESTRKPPY
jgi:hypothetical protein